MFGVPKKGKLVEGTNLRFFPKRSNVLSKPTSERCHTTVRSRLERWGCSLVGIRHNGSLLLFPSRALVVPLQARTRRFLELWLRNLIPHCQREPKVYPALRVMPMGWQSACGLLQYFHRRLCFLPPPSGAGLDPNREIRRDMPLPLKMNKSWKDFFTVYLDGFSQAELVHISELASAAEVPSVTAAVHAAWTNWRIPRHLGKEVIKENEIEVLGA